MNVDSLSPEDNSKNSYDLKVFAALCMSRATRWQIGDIEDIRDAVDWLQEYARRRGLIRQFNQDVIQHIMHDAFVEVRDDIVRKHERYVP